MADAPASPLPYETIGPPVHTTQWNDALQQVQSGFRQMIRWRANGAVFPVFVPEGSDLAAGVDQLARFQGAQFDQLARLARAGS